MCKCKTRQNTINITIGTTAQEILGPNPKRKAIVFQPVPTAAGVAHAISISHRADVAVNAGMLNYVVGQTSWPVLSDNDIGDAIGLPFWAIAGDAGVAVQIVEYSYDE